MRDLLLQVLHMLLWKQWLRTQAHEERKPGLSSTSAIPPAAVCLAEPIRRSALIRASTTASTTDQHTIPVACHTDIDSPADQPQLQPTGQPEICTSGIARAATVRNVRCAQEACKRGRTACDAELERCAKQAGRGRGGCARKAGRCRDGQIRSQRQRAERINRRSCCWRSRSRNARITKTGKESSIACLWH